MRFVHSAAADAVESLSVDDTRVRVRTRET